MHHERVSISPEPPRKGQEVLIHYRGLLAECGADQVWLHYGFDSWKNTHTVNMNKVGENSFSCALKAEGKKEMNFCFKDSAEHWDNNNGQDWNISIK